MKNIKFSVIHTEIGVFLEFFPKPKGREIKLTKREASALADMLNFQIQTGKTMTKEVKLNFKQKSAIAEKIIELLKKELPQEAKIQDAAYDVFSVTHIKLEDYR